MIVHGEGSHLLATGYLPHGREGGFLRILLASTMRKSHSPT
jgi:hypothetical protein